MEFDRRTASGCELVTEVASRFGEVHLKVTGASMMPTVRPGDILTVRSCGKADLQTGQVVLFRREEKLVAHRIVQNEDNLLITRGDSVRHNDAPIRESDIVGQVVSVLRRGRTVDVRLSLWRGAVSRILQRSNFCLRAALRLERWLRQLDSTNEEISWA